RAAEDHTPRRAVLEPGLPAAGVLGAQVRIPAHEPSGAVLEETRLLESRPQRGNRPDALGEPGGGTRAIGHVRAEALIVLEPGADRQVYRSRGARGGLQIDRAVGLGPRSSWCWLLLTMTPR